MKDLLNLRHLTNLSLALTAVLEVVTPSEKRFNVNTVTGLLY